MSAYLKSKSVPHAIYYPVPLHKLPVFKDANERTELPETERAAREVISLPMHTELTEDQQVFIADTIRTFLEEELSITS